MDESWRHLIGYQGELLLACQVSYHRWRNWNDNAMLIQETRFHEKEMHVQNISWTYWTVSCETTTYEINTGLYSISDPRRFSSPANKIIFFTTSIKEAMFSPLSIHLSVCPHDISRWYECMTNRLDFGEDLDVFVDSGSFWRILGRYHGACVQQSRPDVVASTYTVICGTIYSIALQTDP